VPKITDHAQGTDFLELQYSGHSILLLSFSMLSAEAIEVPQ